MIRRCLLLSLVLSLAPACVRRPPERPVPAPRCRLAPLEATALGPGDDFAAVLDRDRCPDAAAFLLDVPYAGSLEIAVDTDEPGAAFDVRVYAGDGVRPMVEGPAPLEAGAVAPGRYWVWFALRRPAGPLRAVAHVEVRGAHPAASGARGGRQRQPRTGWHRRSGARRGRASWRAPGPRDRPRRGPPPPAGRGGRLPA